MIRVTAASAGLVRRLHRRAQRLVDRHLRTGRRKRTGWHSPAALWPDFIDDTPRN